MSNLVNTKVAAEKALLKGFAIENDGLELMSEAILLIKNLRTKFEGDDPEALELRKAMFILAYSYVGMEIGEEAE